MNMKINIELLKKLRKEKSWSQDELATISNLSLRTIQRIEKEGNASLESKKALASAFDIEAREFDLKENSSVVADDETESFYFRIEDGTKLSEVIGGAYAYRINHDNPKSEKEADVISGIAQSIQDWGEIWQDLESGERVKSTFDLSQLIEELKTIGFWLFGVRTLEEYPSIKGEKWPVAI